MANKVAPGPTRREAKGDLSQFRRRIRPFLRKIETWSLSDQVPGDRLRAYHQIGSELRSLNADARYSLAELQKVIGHGRRWQLEVRKFAEEYDKVQLDDLCRVANVIKWGHLRLLLWLPANRAGQMADAEPSEPLGGRSPPPRVEASVG